MNFKSLLVTVAAVLFLTSCKKELQPQETTTDTTAVQNTTAATPVMAPSAATPVQVNQPAQSVTNTTPQPVNVAKTAPGMNPPHGQPNHRCDIAVGAALSSPVAKKQQAVTAQKSGSTSLQPSSSSTPTPTPLAQPATATPTAPGMNPPHGQEGHVCSVAVGAPLPK